MERSLSDLRASLPSLSRDAYLRLREETILRGTFEFNLTGYPPLFLELSRTCLLFSIPFSPDTPSYHCLSSSETVTYRLIRRKQISENKDSWNLILSYRQTNMCLLAQENISSSPWDEILRKSWTKTGFHEEFRPIRKIGRGASASVFQALRLRDNQKVAVKAFPKSPLTHNHRLKQAPLNEIKLMRISSESLNEHVMTLHEIYQSQNSIYLVMDLCSGGVLQTRLQLMKEQMNPQVVRRVLQQILRGLCHLHSNNIAHRDIKLNNILLRHKDSFDVVVADLGLATLIDAEKYLFTRCGTPGYVAPEVVSAQPTQKLFNPNCDVFSAGAIFHLLLTGLPLFPGQTMSDVYSLNAKMQFDITHQRYSLLNPGAFDLLKRMLEVNPFQRISAEQALRHQYFESKEQEKGRKSPVPTALTNHSKLEISDLMLQDPGPRKKEFRKASHF